VAPSLRRLKLEALALNEETGSAGRGAHAFQRHEGLPGPYQPGSRGLCALGDAGSGAGGESQVQPGQGAHLAEALLAGGLDVIETDLGDRINQLAGTPGGHVLAPAVSKDREEIRELFQRELGRVLPSDPRSW